MTADQCNPISGIGQNTVRITMTLDECRRLTDAIMRTIGRTASPEQVKELVEFCQTTDRVVG